MRPYHTNGRDARLELLINQWRLNTSSRQSPPFAIVLRLVHTRMGFRGEKNVRF